MSRAQEAVAQFTLRMPPKLKEGMQKLAKRNHRSLNSEMVAVMERAVKRDDEEKQAEK